MSSMPMPPPSQPQNVGQPLGLAQPPGTPAPFDYNRFVTERKRQGKSVNEVIEEGSTNPEFVNFVKSNKWKTPDLIAQTQATFDMDDTRAQQVEANDAQFRRDMERYVRSGVRAGAMGLGGAVAGGIAGGPPGALAGGLQGAGTQLGMDWMPGLSNFTSSVDQPLGGAGDTSGGANMLLEILKQGVAGAMPGGALARNPGKTAMAQGGLSWLAGEGKRVYDEQPSNAAAGTLELALQAGIPGIAGGMKSRGARAFEKGGINRINTTIKKLDEIVEPFENDRTTLTGGAKNIKSVKLAEDSEKDWLKTFQNRAIEAAPARKTQQKAIMAQGEYNWLDARLEKIKARGGRDETGRFATTKPDYTRQDQLRSELEKTGDISSAGAKALENFDLATSQYKISAAKLAQIRDKTNFHSNKMSSEERAAFDAVAESSAGSDALLNHVDQVIKTALNTKADPTLQTKSWTQLTGLTDLLREKPELQKAVQSKVAKTLLQGFTNPKLKKGQQLMNRISSLGPDATRKLLGSQEAYEDLMFLGGAIEEISNLEKQKIYAGVSATLRPYISHIMSLDPQEILNQKMSGAFDPTGKFDPQGFAKRLHKFVTTPGIKNMTPGMVGERMSSLFKMYDIPTPDEKTEGR